MVFFKGRKIRKLLEHYNAPEIQLKDYDLIKKFDNYGSENLEYIIEFFQQRKIATPKAQFLLNKFCDDNSKGIILPLIGEPYDEIRRVAKELIKKHWPLESTDTLIEFLESPDIYKRNNAVELLGQILDPRCISELISKFNNASSETKKNILKIFTRFNHKNGNRLIISALNESDVHIRLLAMKSIIKLKIPSSVELLIEKLSEKEPQIKKMAVEALGCVGDKRATKPLLELLKDSDLMIRQNAVDALIEIADAESIYDIIYLLKDDDVNVRRCAVEVLRNMKDPKTCAALMQAIKDSDWWVRQIATDSLTNFKGGNIIEGFIGLTEDPDENIRRCAVDFFIQVPSEAAFDTLITLLDDPDWWVREKSIEALGKLKNSKAIQPLLKMAEDPAVCRALPWAFAEISGEEAKRHITDFLFRGPRKLRIETMKLLVKTKGHESIDDLKVCLGDPDKEISSEASLALREITGKYYSAEDSIPANSTLIDTTIAPGSTLTEAIVVIDLCNSTDIISRYGDNFALKLMKKLNSIVEPIAKLEKCQFTKGTGDGYLLTFPTALNSIRFSFNTLAAVAKANKEIDNNHQINLRFAINLGETKVDDKGDRIGVAVNMAFRIEGVKPEAAISTDGAMKSEDVPLINRIFVTENLEKEITKIKGVCSRLVGLYELKGITGLHRIFQLIHEQKTAKNNTG